MTDTNTETLLDIVTRTSRTNNRNMKFYKKTLKNMTDMDIRNNYKINECNNTKLTFNDESIAIIIAIDLI
jgi:hypothetical protein